MRNFTRIFFIGLVYLSVNLMGFAGNSGATGKPQTSPQLSTDKISATLNAYPNPSKGELTFNLSQAGPEVYKIRVSNAIGRVVKTIDVKETGTEQRIDANLSDLPNGFYFYSLLANDKMIETKRLILQR